MELDNYIRGITSSPSTKELDAALVKAQAEYKPIKKSGRNEYAGFDYSTLADICHALLPALLKHGFPIPRFQTGYLGGELVMVGKLIHAPSGEWVSCLLPMRDQIDKAGNRREDNQSMESASTYCRKQLFLQLAGGWSVGAEDMEQAEEAVSQVNAELAKEKEPAPVKSQDYYRRLETKMKMVKSVPAELEKCFAQAESLAQSGDLTAEQFQRLTRQFGALRKREVANAQ